MDSKIALQPLSPGLKKMSYLAEWVTFRHSKEILFRGPCRTSLIVLSGGQAAPQYRAEQVTERGLGRVATTNKRARQGPAVAAPCRRTGQLLTHQPSWEKPEKVEGGTGRYVQVDLAGPSDF